mgnify:CR=1 FL=1
MKKTIITLFTIIFIVVTIICVNYNSYMIEYKNILKENKEFEGMGTTLEICLIYNNRAFLAHIGDSRVYRIELATIINKVVDKNTKNKNDEENSVQIEIYMIDNEQTYKMETFYNAGMGNFIQYYGDIKFRCSKIEYNKNTKRVKYLLFEQIQTS